MGKCGNKQFWTRIIRKTRRGSFWMNKPIFNSECKNKKNPDVYIEAAWPCGVYRCAKSHNDVAIPTIPPRDAIASCCCCKLGLQEEINHWRLHQMLLQKKVVQEPLRRQRGQHVPIMTNMCCIRGLRSSWEGEGRSVGCGVTLFWTWRRSPRKGLPRDPGPSL